MEKVKWSDKITNEEVLTRVDKKGSNLNTVFREEISLLFDVID